MDIATSCPFCKLQVVQFCRIEPKHDFVGGAVFAKHHDGEKKNLNTERPFDYNRHVGLFNCAEIEFNRTPATFAT